MIDVSEIVLACLEDYGLGCLLLGDVEFVEGDDGRRAWITAKGRVGVLDACKEIILIAEEKFSDSAGSGEAVKRDEDANVANVLVEVRVDSLLAK